MAVRSRRAGSGGGSRPSRLIGIGNATLAYRNITSSFATNVSPQIVCELVWSARVCRRAPHHDLISNVTLMRIEQRADRWFPEL
jgi:hypothetical protein